MRFLGFLMRAAIRAYQLLIAPVLPPSCRFLPSCSDYAADAVAIHGPLRGGWLALVRILRCQPWGGPGGHDPVPEPERHADGRECAMPTHQSAPDAPAR